MVRLVDHGISLINKAWSGAAILVDISRIVEEHHHTGCLSSSKSNHSLLFFCISTVFFLVCNIHCVNYM